MLLQTLPSILGKPASLLSSHPDIYISCVCICTGREMTIILLGILSKDKLTVLSIHPS